MKMDDAKRMTAMAGAPSGEVFAQTWDDQSQGLVRTAVTREPAEVDVEYDALLANRRTLDDPEVISVDPGETILLRLIAALSSTNFYVDTGMLKGGDPGRRRKGSSASER